MLVGVRLLVVGVGKIGAASWWMIGSQDWWTVLGIVVLEAFRD